jgi:integrase
LCADVAENAVFRCILPSHVLRSVIAGDCPVIAAGVSMLTKITKRTVDAAVPGQFLWDTELKGFGLKVTASGHKVYILQYRRGGRGSPTKRVTIGRHGPVAPAQARDEATRLLGAIATGSDPAAARADARSAPTVHDLATRFLAEHVATKCKPRTVFSYRGIVDNTIVPALGKRRARDITRADISQLHHDMRETPSAANTTLAVLSKMFSLAEQWGIVTVNPCRRISRYPEQGRERMLSAEEFGRLADALEASDQQPFAIAAIKLLIFTGARKSEILDLQWSWINWERGEARLPDSKTGAKTLHLPAPALAVLAELPRLEGNPRVIPAVVGNGQLYLVRPWHEIRRAAGLDDVRVHDLRHAFASVAASSGMGLPIIGKMLGHTQAATTQRYAHLASDPVKAAVNAVAEKIAAEMKGQNRDKVIHRIILARKI